MQPAERRGSFKCEARLPLCLEAYGQLMAICSILGIHLALLRRYAYFEPEYLPANMRKLANEYLSAQLLAPQYSCTRTEPRHGRVLSCFPRFELKSAVFAKDVLISDAAVLAFAGLCDADEERAKNCAVLFGYLFRCAEISACKYVFLSGCANAYDPCIHKYCARTNMQAC
jgi:hypothetical protein